MLWISAMVSRSRSLRFRVGKTGALRAAVILLRPPAAPTSRELLCLITSVGVFGLGNLDLNS